MNQSVNKNVPMCLIYIYIYIYTSYVITCVKSRGARVNPAGRGDSVSDPLEALSSEVLGPEPYLKDQRTLKSRV